MTRLTLLVPLLLSACAENPTAAGFIVDAWDNPIADADVKVTHGESVFRLTTDSGGRYTLDAITGDATIAAAATGYIPNQATYSVDATNQHKLVVKLYPRPEEAGFYAIGESGFEQLVDVPVEVIGSELEAVFGIQNAGDITLTTGDLKVLFHTDLKLDQIMRMDLDLHKLEFTESAVITGPLRPTSVLVNLWTSVAEVALEVKPLRSKNDYMLINKEPIEAGAYALDHLDLLTPKKTEAFERMPEELRVAYPLQVR